MTFAYVGLHFELNPFVFLLVSLFALLFVYEHTIYIWALVYMLYIWDLVLCMNTRFTCGLLELPVIISQ